MYTRASIQSAQTEPWSLYMPLVLLKCSPPLNQVLLQLWQNETTVNIHCSIS